MFTDVSFHVSKSVESKSRRDLHRTWPGQSDHGNMTSRGSYEVVHLLELILSTLGQA